MKRMTCAGLVVLLVVVALGGVGWAQTEITTWAELNAVRNNLSSSYILMNNLDKNNAGYAGIGDAWNPLGSFASQFTGVFDGNGRRISDLKVNTPANDYVGLFGYIGIAGTVKNLGLVNVELTGQNQVGGLAGNNMGLIENSYATGIVNGVNQYVGGLVGLNNIDGRIIDSHSSAMASGATSVGGLTGCNNNLISNSYATGQVIGTGTDVGGLTGYSNGTIEGSYASGNVEGGEHTGGLVGRNAGLVNDSHAEGRVVGTDSSGGLAGTNDDRIVNSYATGDVTGQQNIGGLVGLNDGTITESYAIGNVEVYDPEEYTVQFGGLIGYNMGPVNNAYAMGNVAGGASGDYIGGLAGGNEDTISNSYATGEVTGRNDLGGLVGGQWGTIVASYYDKITTGLGDDAVGAGADEGITGLTSEGMKDIETFADAGWDIQASGTNLNNGYPYLGWQLGNSPVWYIYSATAPRRRPSAAPESEPEPDYPLPPEGFNAVPGSGFLPSIKLAWLPSESPNIAKYKLYASTGSGASSADLNMNEIENLKFYLLAEVPADVLAYTHTGLSRNVRYYYAVTSVNEEGLESNMSSRILCCVAGTAEINEHEAVSWGPERLIEAPEAEDGSSGCFIATAAYGSAFASEVTALRNFRDGFLLSSGAGSFLVEAYYAASPVFAEAVVESGILRNVARLHIAPFARFTGFVMNMN